LFVYLFVCSFMWPSFLFFSREVSAMSNTEAASPSLSRSGSDTEAVSESRSGFEANEGRH